MTYRNLNVLDAAERAEDMINDLIARYPRRLLHVQQMRDSAHSIAANIGESLGRANGLDRLRPLQIARGEAEETIRHLNANFRARRIEARDYWPIRDLLVTIVKMLNGLLNR